MRKILRNTDEVFHYWANKVQPEGRAGNVFFEGEFVYSYGKHFAIARHLPSGTVAMTTRGYSPTTAGHISSARSAVRHLPIVFCNDPSDGAATNMRAARAAIRDALDASDKPRIRQTTREAHRHRALTIADNANAYLAAIPESERAGNDPIDTGALEQVRAGLVAAEQAARRIREEQQAARAQDLADSLAKWRTGEVIERTGLYSLPVALRLAKSQGTHHTGGLLPDSGSKGRDVIQTSHGAEIPVSFARRLWDSIIEARRTGVAYVPVVQPSVGVYRLSKIRGDGSIVVGCHDIPFVEIENIAKALGLRECVEG